ncbi:MAG: ABC transporter ATP-binding protein, partial [Cyanobacteria bacterium P01_F01_bin.42]
KERDIAMVFQSYALYPHMNVFDNLAFGLRRTSFRGFGNEAEAPRQQRLSRTLVAATRRLPKPLRYQSAQEKAIVSHVHQVAGMLQIDGLLNRLPKELSGGQKQRVALGRAMARNPQVFLMDEPLSNLDAKLRAQTRAQIVRLQKQLGTTTIYVTHDQTEAMTMGDRIAVMNAGVIQQIDSPLTLYGQPVNRFVAGFIGSPPMNFIRMRVTDSQTLTHPTFELEMPPQWQSALESRVGTDIDLGIRPEHLTLAEKPKASMPVTVELVEALGHETYLSVSLPSEEGEQTASGYMNARVAPEHQVESGDAIHLTLDLSKLHLFDVDSGNAVPQD